MSKYRERRKAENHDDCNECGIKDDDCTNLILVGKGSCCPTCAIRNTHPIGKPKPSAFPPPDPREGQAMQASMFEDADSIAKAPITPYAGEHGHSGTDTSHARAKSMSSKNQATVVRLLGDVGAEGMTVAEIREVTDMHHGSASGSLTELHKGGIISRLAEKRGRCKVYVLPRHVDDRTTEAAKGTKAGLAARVASCKQVDVAGVPHIEYDGDVYYMATSLIKVLMQGYEA